MKISLNNEYRPIEELAADQSIKEVELMLTINELQVFAQHCTINKIKFNDWIRSLAYEALKKEEI